MVLEMWRQERRAPVVVVGGGMNWVGNTWVEKLAGDGGGGGGGNSNESEHDLAAMVSDFLEIGSAGAESRSYSSSDNDSCFSDLAFLADKIALYRRSVNQFESDLTVVVHSLILSITETSHFDKPEICNASCVRFSLVKLLLSSGYDAAVCSTKWQSFGKIPGGEHEFIDVISHQHGKSPERYIIDIDFRSHFEIARAIKSYNVVLNSLPSVYVGTMTKLKKFLQIMVEAATFSLKKNLMPLPPWRSLSYLQAKWESPCQREIDKRSTTYSTCPQPCIDLLRKLKSSVESDIRSSKLLIPLKADRKHPLKNNRYSQFSEG